MRKKIILMVCLMLLSIGGIVSAQNLTTGGNYNGYWIESKSMSSTGHVEIRNYIVGIVDCAIRMDPDLMAKYYSQTNKSKIIGAVLSYYKKYPERKVKPVVDIILTGFKK